MPPTKTRKLILFGDSSFAEIAYEYFTHDSPYDVVGFTLDRAYCTKDTLLGLPVIPYEDLPARCPAAEHDVYVAAVYGELNRLRARLCTRVKADGYSLASYISSRAFVWPNVTLGEHCFIFEDNTVQPFVTLGDNIVLWSGNHIGHHSTIESHCFISSHVVVSGHCVIGHHSFIGVNATIGNHVSVGAESWISPATVITRDVPPNSLVPASGSQAKPLDEAVLFKKLQDIGARRG